MKSVLLILFMTLGETGFCMNQGIDDGKIFDFLKVPEIIPSVSEWDSSVLRESISVKDAVVGLFENFVKNFKKKLSDENSTVKLYSKRQIKIIDNAYEPYKKNKSVTKLLKCFENIKKELYDAFEKSKSSDTKLILASFDYIVEIANEIN